MTRGEPLYAGKAKSVYATGNPDELLLWFRDDTSAFDGERVEQLARKGRVNNQFNAHIMQQLQRAGIPTHFLRREAPDACIVRRLAMIPLESVVRNIAAGSLVRRLGVTEGMDLKPPTFELFLKNDALHDPMVNEAHAIAFGWATQAQLTRMRELSYAVNDVLRPLFAKAGILLVDFKLEFGLFHGELMLGDEFSPDGCRLWDAQTRERLDKDRFRRELGDVVESYELVGQRLGITFD